MPENRKRILIVDGQAIFGIELGLILRNLGYDACAQAYNWDQALGLIESLRPDLVLADVQLVESDRAEAPSRLARNAVEVPIVYHTAHSSYSLKAEKVMASVLEVVEMLIRREDEPIGLPKGGVTEKPRRPAFSAVFEQSTP